MLVTLTITPPSPVATMASRARLASHHGPVRLTASAADHWSIDIFSLRVAGGRNARVVDQHVESPEPVDRGVDERLEIGGVRDVGPDGQGRSALRLDVPGDGGQPVDGPCGKDDGVVPAGEGSRRGLADAPAGSGDDRHPLMSRRFPCRHDGSEMGVA